MLTKMRSAITVMKLYACPSPATASLRALLPAAAGVLGRKRDECTGGTRLSFAKGDQTQIVTEHRVHARPALERTDLGAPQHVVIYRDGEVGHELV